MRDRRSLGLLALAASGTALAIGWASGAWLGAPAVYDGLPFNAEPYRYVSPPPGLEGNGSPSSVSTVVHTASHPGGTAFAISTAEFPPQAALIASDGDFLPPEQAVTVGVRPVRAPAVAPAGRPDGNVYQVYVQAGTLRPGATLTVALRGTGAPGSPQLEQLNAGHWDPLPTTHVPPAVYSAPARGVGDFALVLPLHIQAPAQGANGAVLGLVAVGAGLVLSALLLGVIRRLRRRPAAG